MRGIRGNEVGWQDADDVEGARVEFERAAGERGAGAVEPFEERAAD